ncbi:putative transcriptional regulatory protein TcrX [Rosistilla carotiformis]|uniref:Putative transcriptional regulatory protein TcrX n=1 Tax=Rosistilla carotiformis TaxID=2528017 RepID=A0A518K0L9_9BACT|nr:response regulator [Rosistilla carotiformis]QDV71343.1 putative transcriptional regulatory protein TcrX [Rosistilla carotiformis]
MSDEPRLILVVDDSATQLAQMRMLLEKAGYRTLTADDGEHALTIAREHTPDLVVTDLEMPGMSGLDLVMMLNLESPQLPVVLTTSRGSEELAVEALQAGAASYVPKRNLAKDLADTIERTLAVADSERQRLSFAKYIRTVAIELELNNDDSLLSQILSRLEAPLVELGIVTEATRMHIGIALDEALRNAMIHGNLEVPSSLRDQDCGQAYIDMIQARLKEEHYASRRVFVKLTANPEQAVFVITDQGPGFDVSKLPDPTDPENWEAVSGRGLLLIRSFMDEVEHNEVGNQITMVKCRVDPDAIDDDDDDDDECDD